MNRRYYNTTTHYGLTAQKVNVSDDLIKKIDKDELTRMDKEQARSVLLSHCIAYYGDTNLSMDDFDDCITYAMGYMF